MNEQNSGTTVDVGGAVNAAAPEVKVSKREKKGIRIDFNGKSVSVQETLIPGKLYRKTKDLYLLADSVTGKLTYCSTARYNKLVTKFGSRQKLVDGWKCRASRQAERPVKAPKAAKTVTAKTDGDKG